MTFAVPSRPALLALANLLVVALAAWPWLPGYAPSPLPPAASDGTETLRLAALPPFAAFSATLDRPLFSPSRRAEASPVSAPSASIESRYHLQGLVITGKTRHALVAPAAGGRTLELGEGEMLETWALKRIEQDRVVLVSPEGEAVLRLQRVTPAPTR